MAYVFAVTALLVMLAMVIPLLRRATGILEYPVLLGATSLAFFVPQVSAFQTAGQLDGEDVALYFALVIGCLIAARIGWTFGALRGQFNQQFDFVPTWKLNVLILFYFLLGLYGWFKLRSLPPELLAVGTWSDEPVFFSFFANFLVYAMCAAVPIGSKHRNGFLFGLGIVAFALIAEPALYGARRERVTLLVLCLVWWAMLLWRIRLSRLITVMIVILGSLGVVSIGAIRDAINSQAAWIADERPTLSEIIERVGEIDWLNVMTREIDVSETELINAITIVGNTKSMEDFGLGLGWYNVLIAHYVPRQIVGEEVKARMMADAGEIKKVLGGHAPWPGTTYTGPADAYFNLWVLAPLAYWMIGYAVGRVYRIARSGSLLAITLYPIVVTKGLNAFTHSVGNLLAELVMICVVYLPIFVVSRKMVVSEVKDRMRGKAVWTASRREVPLFPRRRPAWKGAR